MKIKYQGKESETDADTVAAFLESQGTNVTEIVVEYKGDILSGEAALDAPLEDGAEHNVFRIVAGGCRTWKCESVEIWECGNGREYLFD